jgi:hypothetical protein
MKSAAKSSHYLVPVPKSALYGEGMVTYCAFMRLAGVIVLQARAGEPFTAGQLREIADWIGEHNNKFDRVRWLKTIADAQNTGVAK